MGKAGAKKQCTDALHADLPRPSAFMAAKKSKRPLQRHELLKYFLDDIQAGHLVTGALAEKPKGPGNLRLVQWNVNGFGGPGTSCRSFGDEVVDVVLRLDADVLVLNEMASNDLAGVRQRLEAAGFTSLLEDSAFPTLMAVRRMRSLQMEKFMLDEYRGAVCGRLSLPSGEDVIVYGTHLHHIDDCDGTRLAEAENLLKHWQRSPVPTIVAADFNQQRKRDYSSEEWQILAQGMEERGEPEDDGVCALFEARGFACSLDMGKDAERNWPSGALPPPTHWTCTAVDYSYAKGLCLRGNYVVQTTASDHLPVVSDWVVSEQ